MKTASEDYIGCYRTFDIDETKGVTIFHVRGAWLPDWIGTDQRRHYTLNRNRLTISSPPLLFDAKKVIPKLIWERVN